MGLRIEPKYNAVIEYEEGFIRLTFSRMPDPEISNELKGLNKKSPSLTCLFVYEDVDNSSKSVSTSTSNENTPTVPFEWTLCFPLTYDCVDVAHSLAKFLTNEHHYKCRIIKLEEEDEDFQNVLIK